jgi:Leucine-rich repeat (LRR) protein
MAAIITSITGLQNLPNLQDFNADYNGLTTVNLSGLANLLYVDISDNYLPGISTNSLTSVNLSGCTALQTLRLDDSDFSAGIPSLAGLNSLLWFDMDQCSISGSIDLSGLPVLEGFDLSGNIGITNVTISSSQPLGDGYEMLLYNNALTQTAVDNILVALAANSIDNGYIDLTEGTNAAPGSAGLAALSTLNGRGWSTDVNQPTTTTTTTPAP